MTSIEILQKSNVFNFEGILFLKDDTKLEPGDLYVAERNSGPKLLTVKKIDHKNMLVIPTNCEYPFNFDECVKVREV